MLVPFLPYGKKKCVTSRYHYSERGSVWEGTGKTWKQCVCFLPLGFCGCSLLTGSCRHFGYARREWRPHWSAFPEVEGKKQANRENTRQRSCLFDTQQDCLRSWMRLASWAEGPPLKENHWGRQTWRWTSFPDRQSECYMLKTCNQTTTESFFLNFQSFIVPPLTCIRVNKSCNQPVPTHRTNS